MRLFQLLATLALAAVAGLASAQEFPSRPIRFISSFPPGGGVDLMARLVAGAMSPRLGQPVVVENRAGAAGVVGSAAVANADPDGYTVLVTGDVPITSAHLLSKVPYDPAKAFIPLVKGVEVPTAVLVLQEAPFKTMKDLIDYAHANPGKVSWGTPGNGTSMHVEVEMLKERLGINIIHVPYKGAAPIMADVMGGTIIVGAPGLPPTIGNIKSGRLRLLAVWGPSRAAVFPHVPTVREALGDPTLTGYPTWYGFLLPAGAPPNVVAKLEGAIIDALKDPGISRKLSEAGATVVAQPSAAFVEANRRQTATFAQVFKKLNLKPD
jgi:tripartite-type tricarboxylate transporter receptor subunit TctC